MIQIEIVFVSVTDTRVERRERTDLAMETFEIFYNTNFQINVCKKLVRIQTEKT